MTNELFWTLAIIVEILGWGYAAHHLIHDENMSESSKSFLFWAYAVIWPMFVSMMFWDWVMGGRRG